MKYQHPDDPAKQVRSGSAPTTPNMSAPSPMPVQPAMQYQQPPQHHGNGWNNQPHQQSYGGYQQPNWQQGYQQPQQKWQQPYQQQVGRAGRSLSRWPLSNFPV